MRKSISALKLDCIDDYFEEDINWNLLSSSCPRSCEVEFRAENQQKLSSSTTDRTEPYLSMDLEDNKRRFVRDLASEDWYARHSPNTLKSKL